VVDDILAVFDRSGVDRNVADDVSAGGLNDVDRADVAACPADRRKTSPIIPTLLSIRTRTVMLYEALGVLHL
jgi:hypothetical protein